MPLKTDDLKTLEKYKAAIKQDVNRLTTQKTTKFWMYKDVDLPTAAGGKQKVAVLLSLVDDVAIKAFLKGKQPLCHGTCGLEQDSIDFDATQGTVPYSTLTTSLKGLVGKQVHAPAVGGATAAAPPRPAAPPHPPAPTRPIPPQPSATIQPQAPPAAPPAPASAAQQPRQPTGWDTVIARQKQAAADKLAAEAEAPRRIQEAQQKAAADQAERQRQAAEQAHQTKVRHQAMIDEFRQSSLQPLKHIADFGDPHDPKFKAANLVTYLNQNDQHVRNFAKIGGRRGEGIFQRIKDLTGQLAMTDTFHSALRYDEEEKDQLADAIEELKDALHNIETWE